MTSEDCFCNLKIVNLSSKELTEGQIKLLSKGLKFTPTPKKDVCEISADIQNFCTKLRKKEFFEDKSDASDTDESLAKNKSNFCPPRNRNITLDNYIDFLTKFPLEELQVKDIKRSNLTREEHNALQELRGESEILIFEADKGGAVVVMDRTYYANKILEMLNDSQTYEEITANKDKSVMKLIKELAGNHSRTLTEKEVNYLCHFDFRTSGFYGLPKIHKSKIICQEAKVQRKPYIRVLRPADLKFRPIVAGPRCPTSRLSNFVDILIKPFTLHVRSYLRDTIDFLNYLPKTVPESTILVSFDVTSLYTNINHELGVKAMEYWINKHPESLNSRFSKEFIIDSILLILTNNTFTFDDRIFLQKKGTAMGTKMAPSYATLVLGYLENELYRQVSNKMGEEISHYVYTNWRRFLDDCYINWPYGEDKLKELHDILNSLDGGIQLTAETSCKELPFLDVMIRKDNTHLTTDIYYKPTDSFQYLPYTSSHPRHTKNNIPYNLARRICMIVEDQGIRKRRLQDLKQILLRKQYPAEIIDYGVNKALTQTTEELRRVREQATENNLLCLVTTYNPNNPQVFQLVRKTLPMLNQNSSLKSIMNKTKVIHSQRQPRNLKRMLTNSYFSKQKDTDPEVKICKTKRCGTCPYLKQGKEFTFSATNETFRIKHSMNCTSTNLIYVITCAGCGHNYIGETGDVLRNRVTVHKQQIRDPHTRMLGVSKHIDECAAGLTPQFTIFPFYKILSPSEVMRKNKERFFISKYKPVLNDLKLR